MPPQQGMPQGTTKTGGLQYNVAALLCYLPVFGISFFSSLIWLLTEPKESKFVRFHAIQSLMLMVCGIGLIMTVGCCSGIMVPMAASSGSETGAEIGGIVAIVLGLFQLLFLLVYLGLHVYGMIKAYGNQTFKIPLIGNFAERRA
jgi:uncharacterized membrane protein